MAEGTINLQKPVYLELGTISGSNQSNALENAFDAISAFDAVVVGTYSYGGIWTFIGYKYSGGQRGYMQAFDTLGSNRYLTVTNNVKTVKQIQVA